MKLSDIKHNHSLTDLLKVFIFSILMLLPFLSVLTRCMYVTFNKNAYQSYSGTQNPTEETIYINDEKNIVYYENYYLKNTYNSLNDYTYTGTNTTDNRIYFDEIEVIQSYDTTQNDWLNSSVSVALTYNTDWHQLNYTFYNQNNESRLYQSQLFLIKIRITNDNLIYNNILQSNTLYQVKSVNYSPLDNVFEYSFQRMSQDDMFNWTQNTALYSGIHAMTTNLQIQTNVIAILLTYWTILTIVYVIIDIVLKCFTLLTHGFSRKTS